MLFTSSSEAKDFINMPGSDSEETTSSMLIMAPATETNSRVEAALVAPAEDGPADATTAPNNARSGLDWKPSRNFLLAFSALGVVILAVAFDATTLSVALPSMSSSIGGTALEAFWSGTSFLLASTVFQPTIAALSSIFGRKYLIYVSTAFFAVGSLVAALANNFTVVIVGRTLQGTGGGGLIALMEVVITDLVPLAVRGQWFSVMSAVWSVGTVAGPLIGAGFAQDVSWRWIFWVNLPIIGVGIIMIVLFLNQTKLPGQFAAKIARFDWIGSALFTTGSTSFLFGLSTGGVMYEWDSWRCLLPLILGPAILVVFSVWEFRFAPEPIIHRGIFNNYAMILSYIMSILHGAILWSLLYFLILYYQGVQLYSPITSAVAVLPETLTVAPAGIFVGVIASMTGHYRWSLWAGWILCTLGLGILLLLEPDTSVPQWIFLNIPVGIGTGMLFPAMALSIQAACDPVLNAEAAAFFSFLRTFGQSIGVAISGVIFQNSFKDKLLSLPLYAPRAAQLSRDATMVVEIIKRMTPSPARDQLMQAYNDALRTIWVAMLAFSAFSLALSVFVPSYTLQQQHMTQQALVEGKRSNDEEAQEK